VVSNTRRVSITHLQAGSSRTLVSEDAV